MLTLMILGAVVLAFVLEAVIEAFDGMRQAKPNSERQMNKPFKDASEAGR